MGAVRVRLLGDVAVVVDGELRPNRSPRLRTLLGVLAVRAGQAVHADLLIDETWGENLPENPRPTLHVALTRLRAWLGDPSLVVAVGGTYRLGVTPADVDLLAFLTHADAAVQGSEPERCAAASALWTGTPLPGHESPRLVTARVHAEERRRGLLVRHATLLLEGGDAAAAVELLADADRLDERIATLLVRALVGAGRPRDAVEVFLDVRRRLLEELGVEPGADLRALYLSLTRAPDAARPTSRVLVGRDEVLDRLLDEGRGGRVVLLDGPAGVGKSAVLRELVGRSRAAGARTAVSAFGPGAAPAGPWLEAAADLGLRHDGDRPIGPWLHGHLVELAAVTPLLVVLDDAHHGDSASLDVLRILARRGLPAGVTLVVAARAPDVEEHPAWRAACSDLLREGRARLQTLGPLSRPAVGVLVRSRLAHLDVDDGMVEAVAARTRGHALHLAALLGVVGAAATAAEAHRAVSSVPPEVIGLIAHQVDRLPEGTRVALEALAVLSPCSLSALARVLDRRPLAVSDDLDRAARAGVVTAGADRYVLRHDLDGDALRARVPSVRAAHLHLARLGTATPGELADPFVVLRHSEGAAPVLDPSRLAEARVHAGVASYRRRALPEALALLDAAEAAPPAAVPTLTVHRALCLEALAARHGARDGSDADDELDVAVDVALAAGDDGLAVLAAIGDEPLGLAIDGDARRAARLRRLVDRPLPPRVRLDLLAAYIREEGASAGRTVPELVAEATALAE